MKYIKIIEQGKIVSKELTKSIPYERLDFIEKALNQVHHLPATMIVCEESQSDDIISKLERVLIKEHEDGHNPRMKAIISAEISDSAGDIIEVDGIDTSRFSASNPMPVLAGHMTSTPTGLPPMAGESHIFNKVTINFRGKNVKALEMEWSYVDTDVGQAWRRFRPDGKKLQFSVGGMIRGAEIIRDDDDNFVGFRITELELVETSLVYAGANPAAQSSKDIDMENKVLQELLSLVKDIKTKQDIQEERLDEIACELQTNQTPNTSKSVTSHEEEASNTSTFDEILKSLKDTNSLMENDNDNN